jgi:nitrogen regulatory protein PII
MSSLLRIVRPKKKDEEVRETKAPTSSGSYATNHALLPLGVAVTVANDGQESGIVALAVKSGIAASFICHGYGTARNDLYDVFNIGDLKKQIIFSILPLQIWPSFKKALAERFAISKFSRGISYLLPFDSMCGVSAYKFLANQRMMGSAVKGDDNMEENQEKEKGYDVVFAIVNDGFTDIVMNAAKKAGARGGTILTARGTGNKEIEKFFGVVITPEKQIVMILVPKDIKDAVLKSIYQEAGINTKGQGIAFSVSASDVVGLNGEEAKANEEEKKVVEPSSK